MIQHQKMPKIVSFDVGYRNLAWCEIHISEDKVIRVSKYGLHDFGKTNSICKLVPSLVAFLRTTFMTNEWDIVIIENQVGSKLRSVQFALQTYFETMKRECASVVVVGATIKFHGSPAKDTRTYDKRKAAAVEIITSMLFDNDRNVSYKEWFDSHPKRDDLADCLLQGIGYMSKKKMCIVDTVTIELNHDVSADLMNK